MSAVPEEARLERFRHLLFMSEPRRWTVWPFLPLVRRKGDEDDCGVLVDLLGLHGLAGYRATVFLTNLFCVPERLEELLALERETFDTPEEVFEAGWRVD